MPRHLVVSAAPSTPSVREFYRGAAPYTPTQTRPMVSSSESARNHQVPRVPHPNEYHAITGNLGPADDPSTRVLLPWHKSDPVS